ncbi:MAG: hypothetical protein ACRDUX_01130, partial [Mycobacterium sp.]
VSEAEADELGAAVAGALSAAGVAPSVGAFDVESDGDESEDAPVDEESDESDPPSACATAAPCPAARAAPTPRATANAPMRPMCRA